MSGAAHDAAATQHPATPPPGHARALRRTLSHASLDTIRPLDKGVRRRITEIADGLRNKTRRDPSATSRHADAPHAGRASRRGRKATARPRDRPEEDRVPSDKDTPSLAVDCASARLLGRSPPTEDDEPWTDELCPTWSPEKAPDGQKIFQAREMLKADIEDLQLHIMPSEPDVTIWDGLQTPHHVFKCRLFLRCTTYPFDAVSFPYIRHFEMHCTTRPIAGSRYARAPVLQTSYEGATPDCLKTANGLPDVRPAAGIHVEGSWRTALEDDGTWGWYRDAYVPLSSRLFDKAEYRRFKLVSRVWLGENCVEGESTFGISMLLREIEMK